MIQLRLTGLLLIALPLLGVGCCSVPTGCGTGSCGMGACDVMPCASGACGMGSRGTGALAGLASCQGACGDVYIDEWISEPPTADNCGTSCGCGQCGQHQPVRNILKLLWGRPYVANCPNDMVGSSCGCDSCGAGSVPGYATGSSCNCGVTHSVPATIREIPSNAVPMKPTPEAVVPTPAPEVDPMASHLNPARRRTVRAASAVR